MKNQFLFQSQYYSEAGDRDHNEEYRLGCKYFFAPHLLLVLLTVERSACI